MGIPRKDLGKFLSPFMIGLRSHVAWSQVHTHSQRENIDPPPSLFKIFIYLRERDREHNQGEKGEAGSLLSRGCIPGPWDHDLSHRQTLK